MIFDQHEFDVRFEWGAEGVAVLAPISQVVVIVDVLSFSTSVDIAAGRGALVYPYRGSEAGAAEYAAALQAQLADRRRAAGRYSLSPASLTRIPAGTRLILPSPNGATLTLAAGPAPVLAGCLRNAQAVALAAQQHGRAIAVIGAGERWQSDGSLRPSFEDLAGAGAVISHLGGRRSPEAAAAVAAFQAASPSLAEHLSQCSSGKELIARGHSEDVRLAAQLNISHAAPSLVDGAYVSSS